MEIDARQIIGGLYIDLMLASRQNEQLAAENERLRRQLAEQQQQAKPPAK